MDIPIYIKYSKKDVTGIQKDWIDNFLSYLPKGSNIIEIGSGTGRDADYLEERGYIVTRTDIYKDFFDYQMLKNNKEVLMLDIEKISYETGFHNKFGGLFINSVLNHFSINQIEKFLIQFKLFFAKNGIVAFNFPKESFHEEIIKFSIKNDYKILNRIELHEDKWVYFVLGYSE